MSKKNKVIHQEVWFSTERVCYWDEFRSLVSICYFDIFFVLSSFYLLLWCFSSCRKNDFPVNCIISRPHDAAGVERNYILYWRFVLFLLQGWQKLEGLIIDTLTTKVPGIGLSRYFMDGSCIQVTATMLTFAAVIHSVIRWL